jgi:DUF177 domain-containing protein
MLRIDLRAVDERPVDVAGTIAADDPIFAETGLSLLAPVEITGRIVRAGPGRVYWRGRIRTAVGGECRRCLAPVRAEVDNEVDLLFVEGADAEDPSEYAMPEGAQSLDLREPVREELVLVAPAWVLCREDCAGLCPQCGRDLNSGACECRPTADPRWAALEGLKDTLPGSEES